MSDVLRQLARVREARKLGAVARAQKQEIGRAHV